MVGFHDLLAPPDTDMAVVLPVAGGPRPGHRLGINGLAIDDAQSILCEIPCPRRIGLSRLTSRQLFWRTRWIHLRVGTGRPVECPTDEAARADTGAYPLGQ